MAPLLIRAQGTNGGSLPVTHDPKDKADTLSPVFPRNRYTMFFGSSLCIADREAIAAVWEIDDCRAGGIENVADI
jgi:hypothetical protein